MKEKLLLISVATILIALASAPLIKAAPAVNIYGYTDRSQYKPGETVTLKLWIHNLDPEGIFLKNITIRYPWYNPIWGGNATIKYEATVGLEENQNRSETVTFTIPTDGRADSADMPPIVVTVVYTVSATPDSASEPFSLNVASAPAYLSFENMDRIVTLLTVLVVLVIVGAIIIAATIFLSMHRPQLTWKAEQKTE